MTNATRLAMIGAAFASFASAARAQDDQFRVAVQSEDLNLASRSGQAMLANRIDAAADKVCGYTGTVSLRDFTSAANCRHAFQRSALDQASRALAMNGKGTGFAGASR